MASRPRISMSRGSASMEPSCRPESADSCGFGPLDRGSIAAIIPRLPTGWRVGKSLQLDNWSAFGRHSDTTSPGDLKASGASRRLFYGPNLEAARSLKTQQRAFTSRPRRCFGTGEETNNLSPSFGGDFEHKLKVTKDRRLAGESLL